jgi:hypothetical protein
VSDDKARGARRHLDMYHRRREETSIPCILERNRRVIGHAARVPRKAIFRTAHRMM